MANVKFLLLIVLVSCLVLESDAWWGGRRRRRISCTCDWFKCHCRFSKAQAKLSRTVSDQTMTRIPQEFKFYDKNGDLKITSDEFNHALRVADGSASRLFQLLDKNGDGAVTCGEFKKARDAPFAEPPKC
ncbi:uncharacterized protein LOC116603362 isoform X2 [Nematostella vectensis]|uniref:uncharacterized protein LOC116603362 isoform X2 n=1 Tax=Nematostella vectensis TaxID=45351 RepID=UPI001390382B|nr:uncharacterized protein LOC116603362 isoform X2 [Nematostella vectensis]